MNLIVKCRTCGKVLGMAENIARDALTVQNATTQAAQRYVCPDGHMLNANLDYEWQEHAVKPFTFSDAHPVVPPATAPAVAEVPADPTIVNGQKVAVAADGTQILNDPNSPEAQAAKEILEALPVSARPS